MAPPRRDVLPAEVWQARREAHEVRVDGWLTPMIERAQRGERHPIEDFLFTYYPYRPAQLRRWSPGVGVALVMPTTPAASTDPLSADWTSSAWVATDTEVILGSVPPRVAELAASVVALLKATAARPPSFGCFGLHEWAMAHRQEPAHLRHPKWPLRLGADATTDVVESLPVRCTHFDAFRFFSETAKPLNVLQPTRDDRLDFEQGGCLHANMDLYKWAFKLFPWVRAELISDCFDLARRARAVDMRASPYDFSALGYSAITIETPSGRREYADAQKLLAADAADLRTTLIAAAQRVLTAERGPAT